MHLDKEKTLNFINNVLMVAGFVANFTPNTNDNAVVEALKRVVANKDLMDLIFEMLEKVSVEKSADLKMLQDHLVHLRTTGVLPTV